MENTIFSIETVTFFNTISWIHFTPVLLFGCLGVLILFNPKIFDRIPKWFLDKFFRTRPKTLAFFLIGGMSFISIGHGSMTYVDLKSEKAALKNGDYEIVIASYDGNAGKDTPSAILSPTLAISFENQIYYSPGGLHGMFTHRNRIHNRLEPGVVYKLYVKDGVILKIEES
jgi:hypothetical protein